MIAPGDRLENPVTGEVLIFHRTAAQTDGESVLVETVLRPGAIVAAAHVHPHQTERFEVLAGLVGLRVGREEVMAEAGDAVTVEPGTPHRFWNAGDDELVCSGYVRPPDNLEYYLTQVFTSMRENGGKRPRMFDAAYLLTRYRSEFGMTDIPRAVQRFVFPIVLAIGRLRGLHRRFAGAPEPVSRSRSA